MARRGNGRQRVVMERMLNESARQVTFSKRRVGLMKKGSELCTLCGAEVVIVVFSPGGKVFSFGHPSADTIIRRFLDEEPELEPGNETTEEIVQAHRCSRQSKLNFHLTQLESLVDEEKKKVEAIDEERNETKGKVWWEKPIEELTVEQLELLMLKMREFKDNVDGEACFLQHRQGHNGHFPSNVMGTGSYVGSSFEPKGKGPASKVPSGGVSFDPMAHISSSLRIPGYDVGVPYTPMMATSSNQAPLDPRTLGFYRGLPYDRIAGGSSGGDRIAGGSSGGVPFDRMVLGSTSSGRSFNPDLPEFQSGSRVDPNASGPRNGGDWRFL